jgi:plastocyanin
MCCAQRQRALGTGSLLAVMIALALFAAGCGQSSSPTSPSNPGNGTLFTIFIKNSGSLFYSPNPLTIRVGQMVNWKNNDTIAHTATLDGVFDTGPIPPMSAHDAPVTMSTAGTFVFHCTLHSGEIGTIIVQ